MSTVTSEPTVGLPEAGVAVGSGLVAAFSVAPFLSLIDRAVVEAAAGSPLSSALLKGAIENRFQIPS